MLHKSDAIQGSSKLVTVLLWKNKYNRTGPYSIEFLEIRSGLNNVNFVKKLKCRLIKNENEFVEQFLCFIR